MKWVIFAFLMAASGHSVRADQAVSYDDNDGKLFTALFCAPVHNSVESEVAYKKVCWGKSDETEGTMFAFYRANGLRELFRSIKGELVNEHYAIGGPVKSMYTLQNMISAETKSILVESRAMPPEYSFIRSVVGVDSGTLFVADDFQRVN